MGRICTTLQPADSELTVEALELRERYEMACEWADGDYQPNTGNAWGLRRVNLKAIHRAVGAGPTGEATNGE